MALRIKILNKVTLIMEGSSSHEHAREDRTSGEVNNDYKK